MLLRIARSFLHLFLLIQPAVACAFSPDPRLLQLVPPGSQIVAGMVNPSNSRQLSSLLLVTHSNGVDYRDFLALTGGDASRRIDQILFVAASARDGRLSEHTLLASGHFDRNAIFRLAKDASASRQSYRGVALLELLPFARERQSFNELRWLAILDERIAILGSLTTVQRELDRWIANSSPDPEILERLSRLDQRDDMWCLIPPPSSTGFVQNLLGQLDTRLGAVARRGVSMEYGIRFGRRVEITASSDSPPQSSWQASDDTADNPMIGLSHFLAQPDRGAADSAGRVVIRVSQQKYEDWFAEFSNRDFNVTGEFVH